MKVTKNFSIDFDYDKDQPTMLGTFGLDESDMKKQWTNLCFDRMEVAHNSDMIDYFLSCLYSGKISGSFLLFLAIQKFYEPEFIMMKEAEFEPLETPKGLLSSLGQNQN